MKPLCRGTDTAKAMKKHRAWRKTVDEIYTNFYDWFQRVKSKSGSLIEVGFSRRDMRDAYEAGYKRARRDAAK